MTSQRSRILDISDRIASGALPFQDGVFEIVALIPPGRVLGYGHVAALAGRPRHHRQVGFALARLEPGDLTPWWRVLRSNGTIALQGSPSRGPLQRQHLLDEGLTVENYRVDMKRHRWWPT